VAIGTATASDTLTISSTTSNGVLVFNSNSGGAAVNAWNTNGSGITFGVRGRTSSASGIGVYGFSPGVGVQGEATGPTGVGLYGVNSSSTGNAFGVQGLSGSASGVGVYGNGNRYGLWAETGNTTGVAVQASSNATSGTNYGVVGQAVSPAGIGVFGTSPFYGVQGQTASATGRAVFGNATGSTGANSGVYGQSASDSGAGVFAINTNATANLSTRYGLFAQAATVANSYAGFFQGNVHVAGTLSAAVKNFRIDHPLDPQNKYLNHVSVESPEMKTIYDGVVVLDTAGEATVELPGYFESLNGDFRYQLTCVGGWAPIYIAREIDHNRFTIAGGREGMKVSWQVTGVRRDRWARENPVVVEQSKVGSARGQFINPIAPPSGVNQR
jgi:hypothetical protein